MGAAYSVENGLLEGALLSPFLYTVFIDGLMPRELRRRALDRWTRYVAERERTGMAFYCGASAPGAVGGLRTRVPPAGCDLTGRRMLVAQRLGGHYLQSCVGA